jgi:hypothetical protein
MWIKQHFMLLLLPQASSRLTFCKRACATVKRKAALMFMKPHLIAYSWFRPQGSNRDGIRRMSHPAMILQQLVKQPARQ